MVALFEGALHRLWRVVVQCWLWHVHELQHDVKWRLRSTQSGNHHPAQNMNIAVALMTI